MCESTNGWWISHTKGQESGKYIHVMTSRGNSFWCLIPCKNFIEKVLTAETFILMWYDVYLSLQLHNECDGISDHQSFDCLFNCLFRRRSKKTSKLHITVLCKENPLATGGFSSQRASSTENVSIWWLHHDIETHAERISVSLSSPPNDNQWENIIYNWLNP